MRWLLSKGFQMSAQANMTNPLGQIEHAQATLAQAEAPVVKLEEARLELQRVVASSEADLEEIGSRRKIELLAHAPAAELNRKLEALEKAEKEVSRRVQIANAILSEVETRIVRAREAEIEQTRQANFSAALALHVLAAKRVKEFCGRVGPEAAEVMQLYRESEAATLAANKDRPAGAPIIPSIESERQGPPLPAKITERRFQVFVAGREPVGEVGKVEAHNVNGSWAVYRPSRSVQGDVVIPHCTIVDYVEATIQKYEPRPLEALSTSLRIPAFDAPAPGLGRAERRLMPASEWSSMNAQPDPLAVAAE
jgi:hypothetical protein